MKVQSLCDLDPKVFVDFSKLSDGVKKVYAQGLSDGQIWKIPGFLSVNECDYVLSQTEKYEYTSLEYDANIRDSVRLLVFDNTNEFVNLIEQRLQCDCLPQRLNDSGVFPCGFGTASANWQTTCRINPCLRFNRYQPGSKGFNWHYDGQYTESIYQRSAWTFLIYLEGDGDTIFQTTDDTYNIVPQVGTALIFDQRLYHMGSRNTTRKTVLRTDIMCNCSIPPTLTGEEERLDIIMRNLFRQAQYYELQKDNDMAGWLYDAVIEMRITNKIPADMEIEDMLHDVPVTCDVRLLSRSARSYKFQTTSIGDDALKVSALFAILTETSEICKGYNYQPLMKKLLRDMFIEIVDIPAIRCDSKLTNCHFHFNMSEEFEEEDPQVDEPDMVHAPASKDSGLWQNKHIICSNFSTIKKYDRAPEDGEIPYIYPRCAKDLSISPEISDRSTIVPGVYIGFEAYSITCGQSDMCPDPNYHSRSTKTMPKNLYSQSRYGDMVLKIIRSANNSGTIHMTGPGMNFNHASCNCDTLVLKVVDNVQDMYFTPVQFDAKYTVTHGTFITIDIVPRVVV